MADDLRRLEHLPGQLYNFHPGSHVGQGIEAGIDLIAQGLNAILRPEQSATVLLGDHGRQGAARWAAGSRSCGPSWTG